MRSPYGNTADFIPGRGFVPVSRQVKQAQSSGGARHTTDTSTYQDEAGNQIRTKTTEVKTPAHAQPFVGRRPGSNMQYNVMGLGSGSYWKNRPELVGIGLGYNRDQYDFSTVSQRNGRRRSRGSVDTQREVEYLSGRRSGIGGDEYSALESGQSSYMSNREIGGEWVGGEDLKAIGPGARIEAEPGTRNAEGTFVMGTPRALGMGSAREQKRRAGMGSRSRMDIRNELQNPSAPQASGTAADRILPSEY